MHVNGLRTQLNKSHLTIPNTMIMKNTFIYLLFIGILSACVIQPNDKKNISIYENKSLGWSVEYPNNWKVLNNDEIIQSEGNSKKALDTLNDTQMHNKNLIWVQKDGFNSFSSTVQSFDSLIDGSYDKTQEALFQAMLDTYYKQGLNFQYKVGKDKIDDLEFKTYFIKFLSPDRKNIILYQVIFDRLIDGKNALTLSINFNNENDRQALIDIVKSSKLTIRN
jgi:hypothetical protein